MKQIKKIYKPNQINATLALAVASLKSTFRNPSALFFSFLFPLIFISVFGLLGRGSQTYDIGVREDSLQKGPLYEALTNVEILNLVTDKNDAELDEQLEKGQISIVINIDEKTNNQADLSVYELTVEKSAADPRNSATLENVIDSIVQAINHPDTGKPKLISVNTKTVEGRKFEQIDFILPGQLSFALLSNALFGISMTIITLRKELVIKRIFATPINKSSIILAEALSKIVLALLQSILIIIVGHLAFGFTLANGMLTLVSMIVLSIVGIFMFMAFGLLVSTLGDSEDAISPIANLIMMPQLFLSGAFFPIDAFPEFLQPIAKILPMTFLNDAFRSVAFEGNPLSTTLPQIAGLLVWAIIIYALVARMFRWE